VVPHITTILWSELRPGTRLLDQPWPSIDANALVQDSIELVVQVNGKLRGRIRVPTDAPDDYIRLIALEDEAVRKFVTSPPKKVVIVPKKLVNVVV
jgi:leucyl-tRNA synthetase